MAPTIKYMKCLNRDSLIDFLAEQKFFTVAQMLQSKDIDGERFLNFTELDLVQWGLTANQKKIILDCRNTLIDRTTQEMIPRVRVFKKTNQNLEKKAAKQTKTLDAALEPNKNGKPNRIRPQRPLPAPPKETYRHSDINTDQTYELPKSFPRQSLQYMDMTKGTTEPVENLEDYVDMNASSKGMGDCLNVSSAYKKSAPKIPERPNLNLNPKSPQHTAVFALVTHNRTPDIRPIPQQPQVEETEDYLVPKPVLSAMETSNCSNYPLQTKASHLLRPNRDVQPKPQQPQVEETKNYLVPKPVKSPQHTVVKHAHLPTQSKNKIELLKGAVQENAAFALVTHNRTPDIRPIPQQPQVEETEDYLVPKPVLSAMETSNRCNYPLQTKASHLVVIDGKNCPPLPERPPKLSSASDSEELDSIYEAEPIFKSKEPAKTPRKAFIQNIPLPPIPNETRDSKNTSASSSPLPKVFNTPTEKISISIRSSVSEKPKLLPKPPIHKKSENWDIPRPDSSVLNLEFGLEHLPLPPPPPEFLDERDTGVTARSKEEAGLPTPPVFNRAFVQEQIRSLRELIPDEDSSDDEMFNINNCIFYRNTDRRGAKQLLQKVKDLKNDTFLLRPSTNEDYYLGLTIFHDEYYYNFGIHRGSDGKFYGESSKEGEIKKFSTLDSFLDYYKYNALTVKKKDGQKVELYLEHSLPYDVY